jgi:hypothetical protein
MARIRQTMVEHRHREHRQGKTDTCKERLDYSHTQYTLDDIPDCGTQSSRIQGRDSRRHDGKICDASPVPVCNRAPAIITEKQLKKSLQC